MGDQPGSEGVTLTQTPSATSAPNTPPSGTSDERSLVAKLVSRISRAEIAVAALIALVMLVLVIIEPNILEAPFENANTILFTVGGTVLAAAAFVAMLFLKVPAPVRIAVLVIPFAIVNWWLLSPYFVDDVVDEEFTTSIFATAAPAADPVETEPIPAPAEEVPAEEPAAAATETESAGAEAAAPPAEEDADAEESPVAVDAAEAAPTATPEPAPTATPVPTGPVLLGAGRFVGLAGHDGVGDAGIFRNPDGSQLLRFENFDIENGPDLEVYLVPGADQVDLVDGSIHLGPLKGNIGDQNYELPEGIDLTPGAWTVLVWCEAFSVEFVGATLDVSA